MKNNELGNLLKDINTSLLNGLNAFIDIYDKIIPKVIKRKIRVKGKIKYIKLIRINRLYDLLPSPRFLNIGLRCLLKGGRI